MNTKQEREALIKSSMELIEAVERRGNGFTSTERAELKSNERRIAEIDTEGVHDDQALLATLRSSFKASEGGAAGSGETRLAVKSAGIRQTAQALATGFGKKDLIAGGGVAAAAIAPAEIYAQGQIPTSLLEMLPAKAVSSPVFRFLRGTHRDMQAGVVAPGETKPTSTLGLTPVDERLRVVAHLSEGIDHYSLTDVAMLQQFLIQEMTHGLYRAVEDQVLNGDGTGENMTGILATSGIQTVDYQGDVLSTIRRALTASESLGYHPGVVVLSPSAWEAAETSVTSGSGEYLLASSPVDRAARRVWGAQVVVSSALPADTGLLIDPAQVTVYTDPRGVQARFSESHEDSWAKNEVVLRVEGRWASAVQQAAAHVQFPTVSAYPPARLDPHAAWRQAWGAVRVFGRGRPEDADTSHAVSLGVTR